MEGVSMRPPLIVAALIFVVWAVAAAAPVQAQSDSRKPEAPKAACHGADGKAQPCAPKKRPSKTRTAMPMISQCRNITSHQLTRCGGPNAEPVPAN
jgi:hypothetical protein